MLRNITHLEKDGGDFPDLSQVLEFFDNAFDHSSARYYYCFYILRYLCMSN